MPFPVTSHLTARIHRAERQDFNLFTRAWCVAEIHRAQLMGMPQRMSWLTLNG